MTSMSRRMYRTMSVLSRLLLILAVGFSAASCGQALLTAPVGSTMVMTVNPSFIALNGDTATVSVIVIEPAGTPVPDGTVVQFFTTLGKIQEQAKTNDGVARVKLISDANSGTAEITAFSGGVTTDAKSVTVGATRPATVRLFAIDPVIDLKTGRTIANFRATVLDDKGNPVSGVLVRFTSSDPAQDTILDNADRATNNNGEVVGRVQTKRTTAGTITLRADVLAATALTDTLNIVVIE
ncbi:MAG: hypothetical protein ABI672_22045 [Vicinamibacteria bacterium]